VAWLLLGALTYYVAVLQGYATPVHVPIRSLLAGAHRLMP
jgi:hypothetical protein